MLAGTALYIRLIVYVGLSLFIISGLYVYMVVCVVYAYNLTIRSSCKLLSSQYLSVYEYLTRHTGEITKFHQALIIGWKVAFTKGNVISMAIKARFEQFTAIWRTLGCRVYCHRSNARQVKFVFHFTNFLSSPVGCLLACEVWNILVFLHSSKST